MAFPEKTRRVDDLAQAGPYTYVREHVDNRWDQSDRVAGQLILRPQRCEMISLSHRLTQTGQTASRQLPVPFRVTGAADSSMVAEFPNRVLNRSSSLPAVWGRLDSRARARLLGKMNVPTASLAVTLSQWRSAASMLNLNGKNMLALVNAYLLDMARIKAMGRKRKRGTASDVRAQDAYLEFIFGWVPLHQELVALCAILTSHEFKETYLRASSGEEELTTKWAQTTTGSYATYNRGEIRETCRSVLSARVSIRNPNFWMANQLGLLNLPGAVVDIIPWSFVTGMFWNQAQFVSQFTDTIGLEFRDISLTRSFRASYSAERTAVGSYYRGNVKREARLTQKQRSLDQLPSVSASTKDFEMDVSKAAMFLALAAQKLAKAPVSVLNPKLA